LNTSATPVLEVRNVTKIFPGVVANQDVNLNFMQGEILALLGENGAGKSTLMNIIYGLYHPTHGEILVNGQPVRMKTPRDAIKLRHRHGASAFPACARDDRHRQHHAGRRERQGRAAGSQAAVAARIRELSERYSLEVDPYAMIEDLPVGVRQRVEIIKALYRNADILILDEPTAVLTPQEIEGCSA
jgi:ABC-type uncharacterized transport system ATPase subunit